MTLKDSQLEHKRVLITGAEGGIGSALAHRFAMEGARICLNTFATAESCAALVTEINSSARFEAFAVQADICNVMEIDRLFQTAVSRFDGIDILVNNAGVESVQSALDLPVEEWDRILNTNLRGSFLCAQRAGRIMRTQENGGVILNVSSIHDTIARLGTAHYGASKAGLTMLTKALALEWAEYGIRVVGISPGAIETRMNQHEIAKIGRSKFAAWIPAGRLGTTDDIADAAVFLVSEQASYVTGATLYVDGAYSLNTIHYDPRGWHM
ncbi:MAG: glucose 1-dehydrogenase [Acidobacteriaceae bacterium]